MAFQWAATTDEFRVMVIDDPTALQVFLQPLRFRLLRSLDLPASVAEIADLLGETTTRLYYHVRLLERMGLIEVIERRQIGSNMERLYRRAAERYEIADELAGAGYRLASAGSGVAESLMAESSEFASLLRRADANLADAIEGGRVWPGDQMAHFVVRSGGRLEQAAANELGARLQGLLSEYFGPSNNHPDASGVPYAVLVAFTPADEER
jgi:DNA-binding transcriptional ArsR family regulator